MTERTTKRHGELFIVSAPSGAGKTSLVSALVETVPNAAVSISHTTRPRRPHEVDGINYYFIDEQSFKQMQADGAFVESATVFGNLYGTSKAEIDRITHAGDHVILEIDWQGAQQIRVAVPGTRSIFILPPSTQSLRERLLARAEDDEATIERRMAAAVAEMSHYREFDYIVVNDEFDEALRQMREIVEGRGQPYTLEARQGNLEPLIADLLP